MLQSFFFNKGASWTSLAEVQLKDGNNKQAGNIDYVLVSYDNVSKNVLNFGAIEVQAVYISGNVSKHFENYMNNLNIHKGIKPPRPDFLSSSRKRLAPQLIFKGGILKAWNKKQVVVLQKEFFDELPKLPEAHSPEKADIMWLVYDLKPTISASGQYTLSLHKKVYTEFHPALNKITLPVPGDIKKFMNTLQSKLDQKLESLPPDNFTIIDDLLI